MFLLLRVMVCAKDHTLSMLCALMCRTLVAIIGAFIRCYWSKHYTYNMHQGLRHSQGFQFLGSYQCCAGWVNAEFE